MILPLSIRFLERSRPDNKFSIVVLPDPEGPKIAETVIGSNLPEHYLSILLVPFCIFYPSLASFICS